MQYREGHASWFFFLTDNYRFKGYRIEIHGNNSFVCYQDTSEPYPDLYQNNICIGSGRAVRIVQTHSAPGIWGPLLELCEVEVYGNEILSMI